jgi:hypothetical protein
MGAIFGLSFRAQREDATNMSPMPRVARRHNAMTAAAGGAEAVLALRRSAVADAGHRALPNVGLL